MFISRRRNFMKARIQYDVINRSVHNAKKETSTSIDAIPYIHIRWRYTEFFCAVNIDQCNSHSVHLRWSGEKCQKFEYALRHVGRMVNMTRKEGKDEGSWHSGLYRDEEKRVYGAYRKSMCTLACCHIAYAFVRFHECMYCASFLSVMTYGFTHDNPRQFIDDFSLRRRLINHFTTSQLIFVSSITKSLLKNSGHNLNWRVDLLYLLILSLQ